MALPLIARNVLKAAALRGITRSVGDFQGNVSIELRANIRGAGRDIERMMMDHDAITAISLNKAARSARTATARELAQVKGLPQKILRKRVQWYKASRRKKPIRSSLWVGVSKPITANELTGQTSLTKSGNVKIGRRVFRGAFPATMPSGHKGIFTRKSGARHRTRADGVRTQLPIEESIVQLQPEAERISRRMAEKALREVYPKELRRLMELRARRWRV